MGQKCRVCKSEILIMCFRNTDVCSEICRKRRDKEITAKELKKLRA